MDSIQGFNRAMAYIEENLFSNVHLAKAAQAANCSEYHFKRVFSFLAGMPAGEYIRRRRLSVAAAMLQGSDRKIIDIAMDLGYDSPDAFAKAFHSMHGVTPSQARINGIKLKAFPPMVFRLTVEGGEAMDYRIIEKEAFYIAGFKKRITLVFTGVNPQMADIYERLTPETILQLKGMNDTDPKGILSVSANFSCRTTEGSELDQYVGVAVSAPPEDAAFDILSVEAATWAVFPTCGKFPQALQETWAKIYAQWWPGSGFELTEGPEILWNESPDTTRADYKSEIWIPVKKTIGSENH